MERLNPVLMPPMAVPISVTATMPMMTPSAVRKLRVRFADELRVGDPAAFDELETQAVHVWVGPSLSINPSRRRTIRRACSAMSGSWVTTMIVLPCA